MWCVRALSPRSATCPRSHTPTSWGQYYLFSNKLHGEVESGIPIDAARSLTTAGSMRARHEGKTGRGALILKRAIIAFATRGLVTVPMNMGKDGGITRVHLKLMILKYAIRTEISAVPASSFPRAPAGAE